MTRPNTITDPEQLYAGWRWEVARGKALTRWGRNDLANGVFAIADEYRARLEAAGIQLEQPND